MAEFAPTVTSVMHGGHVAGSAHYQGRAIDVGAFGGTDVGVNEPTVLAIVSAIRSGQFQSIGTIPELAQNPMLQGLAQQAGVDLFTDVGSGPHVHFQVGSG